MSTSKGMLRAVICGPEQNKHAVSPRSRSTSAQAGDVSVALSPALHLTVAGSAFMHDLMFWTIPFIFPMPSQQPQAWRQHRRSSANSWCSCRRPFSLFFECLLTASTRAHLYTSACHRTRLSPWILGTESARCHRRACCARIRHGHMRWARRVCLWGSCTGCAGSCAISSARAGAG